MAFGSIARIVGPAALSVAILFAAGACDRDDDSAPVIRVPIASVQGDGVCSGQVLLHGVPPVMKLIVNQPCHPGATVFYEETVVANPVVANPAVAKSGVANPVVLTSGVAKSGVATSGGTNLGVAAPGVATGSGTAAATGSSNAAESTSPPGTAAPPTPAGRTPATPTPAGRTPATPTPAAPVEDRSGKDALALANVVVWIDGLPATVNTGLPPATLDQKNCRYVPHVVAIAAGQRLEVVSSDPCVHNVHLAGAKVISQNFTMNRVGETKLVDLPRAGLVKSTCDVHPWMLAYVYVINHPFFAVTDDQGRFSIPRLPPGTYTLRAWHELYGPLEQQVVITKDQPTMVNFDYRPPAP